MANIKDVLYIYGSAARNHWPQGDDVEDAMLTIIHYINEYGYEFSDKILEKLKRDLGFCPIKDQFQCTDCCEDCEHAIEKKGYYTYYKCGLRINR